MKALTEPLLTVPPKTLSRTHCRGRLAIQCGQSCFMPAVSMRATDPAKLISGELSPKPTAAEAKNAPSPLATVISSMGPGAASALASRSARPP